MKSTIICVQSPPGVKQSWVGAGADQAGDIEVKARASVNTAVTKRMITA